MLAPPYPELAAVLGMMGEAGTRLSEMEASEGAAGNISVWVGWPVDPAGHFPAAEDVTLPHAVPELAGTTFLVTGSGRRLREIADDPGANVACIVVGADGRTATSFHAPGRRFERVTTEFNSHLAVHHDQVRRSGTRFSAVVHAQPLHLTYLSHVPRYQDERGLNRALLRWQPETVVNFPSGLGFLPFEVPGSDALMDRTVEALREHRLVVWSRHGVMSRSDATVKRAVDLIDYAETAARYEYLNLAAGEPADGLSDAEICAVCDSLGIEQSLFSP